MVVWEGFSIGATDERREGDGEESGSVEEGGVRNCSKDNNKCDDVLRSKGNIGKERLLFRNGTDEIFEKFFLFCELAWRNIIILESILFLACLSLCLHHICILIILRLAR